MMKKNNCQVKPYLTLAISFKMLCLLILCRHKTLTENIAINLAGIVSWIPLFVTDFENPIFYISVFKYPVSKNSDRRMYVWGLAETGALGLHQPRGKRGRKAYLNDFKFAWHPMRSSFAERFDVSLLDIWTISTRWWILFTIHFIWKPLSTIYLGRCIITLHELE